MTDQSIRIDFLQAFTKELISNWQVVRQGYEEYNEKDRIQKIKERILIDEKKDFLARTLLAQKPALVPLVQKKPNIREETSMQESIMVQPVKIQENNPLPKMVYPKEPPKTDLLVPQAQKPSIPVKNMQLSMASMRTQEQPRPLVVQPQAPSPPPSQDRVEKDYSQSQKLPHSDIQKINVRGLEKMGRLLSDRAVQTIECPGPEKPVLVYRSGVIQTTNITLSTEEITRVMKEVSEKTRIPLISGVFKAAFDEFIITAVMSEYVGARFIINRKPTPSIPGP